MGKAHIYVYVTVVSRPRVDNWYGDQNPYLYSQQNNYIAQVKLDSSTEIAQEAASFSNLVAILACVREFASNNQCRTFLYGVAVVYW